MLGPRGESDYFSVEGEKSSYILEKNMEGCVKYFGLELFDIMVVKTVGGMSAICVLWLVICNK